MRRPFAPLVLALLAAAVATAGSAGRVQACSCAGMPPGDIEEADVAFVGTAIERRASHEILGVGGSATADWTFSVERPLKGLTPGSERFTFWVNNGGPGSCAPELAVGMRYRVHASFWEPYYTASSCSIEPLGQGVIPPSTADTTADAGPIAVVVVGAVLVAAAGIAWRRRRAPTT